MCNITSVMINEAVEKLAELSCDGRQPMMRYR